MTVMPTLIRPRPVAFLAACVAVVAATYLGSAFVPSPRAPLVAPTAPGLTSSVPQPQAEAPSGTRALIGALDHEIGLWTRSLSANPADFIAAGRLGSLTLQRARITGDLADYQRALEAADRSIEADPIFWSGHALRASTLFALHDFSAALDEAESTYAAAPDQLDALAVIGDANLELGDLEAAGHAYAELAEAAPSPPAWSRLAHLAFLRGDAGRAIELVLRCVNETPASDASGTAFYATQLGELQRSAGNLDEAESAYIRALDALDGYVPALAGLAGVREAQGRRAEAIDLLERASTAIPQPDLVAALGDLYSLAGDAARADEQYALVDRIGRLSELAGGVYDRQLILVAADHGVDVEWAVTAAEESLRARRDVYGYDAHAWALYAAGRIEEAAAAVEHALALGTPDPRLAYHAGMIALAEGRAQDARDLLESAVDGRAALPPIQAERAVATLARLAVES